MNELGAHQISDLRALADRTGGDDGPLLHTLLDAYEVNAAEVIADLKGQVEELENDLAEAESDRDDFAEQVDDLQDTVDELNEEIAELKAATP